MSRVVAIRELDEQEKVIKKIITFEDNTILMLKDDLEFFQENLNLIPEQGNIRLNFRYLSACEEYKGFYSVELVILTVLSSEHYELDTMFPTFNAAWEVLISQFLCVDNKGKGIQAQMIEPKHADVVAMYSDRYKGDVTILCSKKIH